MKEFLASGRKIIKIVTMELRRNFSVSAIGLVFFFLADIFPLIVWPQGGEKYIIANLSGSIAFVRLYTALMPIAISLALFSYLHRKNSVTYIHQLPFTRTQLFTGKVIAGIVLIMIPVIIPVCMAAGYIGIGRGAYILFYSFISSVFVFSVCVFAGILCGTSFMHVIAAVWFNVLPHSLVILSVTYCNIFLKGYNTDHNSSLINRIADLSPVTCRMREIDADGLTYLAVAVVVYAVAGMMYRRTRLERAEDPIMFRWVKILMNIIIGLYAMAVLGLLFYSFRDDTSALIIASAAGAVTGAAAGYMLLNKTFKVICRDAFKMAAAVVIIGMIFTGAFMTDIFGFEGKVPETGKVDSVEISLFSESDSQSMNFWDNEMYSDEGLWFDDKDIIANVVSLHEMLIKENRAGSMNEFTVVYRLKNGRTMTRSYDIPDLNYRQLKYIYESGEYKEKTSVNTLYDSLDTISIYGNTEPESAVIRKGDRRFDRIMQTVSDDIRNRTYERFMSGGNVKYYVDFGGEDTYIQYAVYYNDRKSVKMLDEIVK